MTFKRTKSGLTNQHLFYNAEYVIYVEGGESFNKNDVYNGNHNDDSIDIVFWKNALSIKNDIANLKFKAVGSKTTLKEIAADIVSGDVNHVIVAMDSEFDGVHQNQIKHPKVFYTYGYSWENDVWGPKVIKEIIEHVSATKYDGGEVEKAFRKFLKDIKIAVYADGYLFSQKSSFIPRKSSLSCIQLDYTCIPCVISCKIEELLGSKTLKKGTLYSYSRRKKIDVLKHCYGHLLADYCYQIISYVLKKVLKVPSINKEVINRMAIAQFVTAVSCNQDLHQHYSFAV